MENKTWMLYVVMCSDGTLYTGITVNLERRLEQHNRGIAAKYTRTRGPVTLVYQETCESRSDALRKEHGLKRKTKKEKEDYIKKK